MFSSKVNSVTGRMEWEAPEAIESELQEESDVSKELFRSQYGDMLHDTERNNKFYKGVMYAVRKVQEMGMEPHVLDIGTGTGLLSLMAAKCGAKEVTACEVLKPMAKVAKEVVKQNGYGDVITVIPKRSTEMKVGPNGDMSHRANILVTEMFDTELIGEAALSTFIHAHRELLEKGSIVVPQTATVIAQPVQSELLYSSQMIHLDKLPFPLRVPPTWGACWGPPSQWDLHVEEIPPDQWEGLATPQHMITFNFEDPTSLSLGGHPPPVTFKAAASGVCHCLVIWWETQLAPGVVLSTSPHYPPQWRDHWLQCVQVLSEPLAVTEGDELEMRMHFDEYSMWFDIHSRSTVKGLKPVLEHPVCTCGTHMVWSRVRLSMLNEPKRNALLHKALSELVKENGKVLVLSDGSLLPFMAASLGAKEVWAVEDSGLSCRMLTELITENELQKVVSVVCKLPTELTPQDVGGAKFDVIVGEPFFSVSLLPWHNLMFWYAVTNCRVLLNEVGRVAPCAAKLKAIAVHFDNLHKIKLPVGVVEGFDLSAFDDARGIGQDAGRTVVVDRDANVEPHPLWEYPCVALSNGFTVMEFDFTAFVPEEEMMSSGTVSVDETSDLHAVVLWMDYELVPGVELAVQGPVEPVAVGEKISWSFSQRQAVVFFPFGQANPVTLRGRALKHDVMFEPKSGNLQMRFSMQ